MQTNQSQNRDPSSSAIDPDNWLLVTDVDNTLLGDTPSLLQFRALWMASNALDLALNSSRPCLDVRGSLDALSVPLKPKAIVGGMGTQIEIDGNLVDEWTNQFAGWTRAPIDQVLSAMGFQAHSENLQTPFKVSYAVPRSEQQHATEAIRACGVDARIIVSGESDFDVLPPNAGKGTATIFLARRLKVPLDRVIVAGDSGNDADMFESARKGILVGNATDALRAVVDPSRTFSADGQCAAGLIEGLRYWKVPLNPIES